MTERRDGYGEVQTASDFISAGSGISAQSDLLKRWIMGPDAQVVASASEVLQMGYRTQ